MLSSSQTYYVFMMGQDHGPYDFLTLQQMVRSKQVKHDTLVRVGGSSNTLPFDAKNVPGLFSQKEWLTALLLALFLGYLGVDRFYVGHIWLGVLKIVVTIVSCFTLGMIWWLVDVCLIAARSITDKNGLPLR